jgi:hypothetical protein
MFGRLVRGFTGILVNVLPAILSQYIVIGLGAHLLDLNTEKYAFTAVNEGNLACVRGVTIRQRLMSTY